MENIKRLTITFLMVPFLALLLPSRAEAETFYGFAGKPYDTVTGLYDFGYRDYNPRHARFTTQDPLRDGLNWYAYAGQDPVNFVDLLGLKNVGIKSAFKMSEEPWGDMKLTGWTEPIRGYGCAVTLAANIQNTRGKTDNPATINDKYVKEGDLYWDSFASANGMTAERIRTSYTAADYERQEADIYNTYYTGIQVPYKDDALHWVGVEDVVVLNDKNYFVVSATSVYDTYADLNSNREAAGWIKAAGNKVLIPETAVKGAVVFKQEKQF